jgi:hypothetical protein
MATQNKPVPSDALFTASHMQCGESLKSPPFLLKMAAFFGVFVLKNF